MLFIININYNYNQTGLLYKTMSKTVDDSVKFREYIRELLQYVKLCKTQPELTWTQFKKQQYYTTYKHKKILLDDEYYTTNCAECGVEIVTKRNGVKFCSETCKKTNWERVHKHYCVVCNTGFFSTRSDAKYCSYSCKSRAYYWRVKNNPN